VVVGKSKLPRPPSVRHPLGGTRPRCSLAGDLVRRVVRAILYQRVVRVRLIIIAELLPVARRIRLPRLRQRMISDAIVRGNQFAPMRRSQPVQTVITIVFSKGDHVFCLLAGATPCLKSGGQLKRP